MIGWIVIETRQDFSESVLAWAESIGLDRNALLRHPPTADQVQEFMILSSKRRLNNFVSKHGVP